MDDELRLEAGKLVLFRRNGLWQARISIGNRKYLWKSLKTSNTAEAKRLGLKLFHQTEYKLGEGLPVQTRSFSDVIDEYIAEREADNKLGKEAKRGSSIKHTSDAMLRQIKRVSKFWKEYAGKRAIEAIDDRVLRDFIPWRKAYYHKHDHIHHNAKRDPTDKTLQFDLGICKMVLRYAKDQNYFGNKPLPTFAFTPKPRRVRPAFTPIEFRSLGLLSGNGSTLPAAIQNGRALAGSFTTMPWASGCRRRPTYSDRSMKRMCSPIWLLLALVPPCEREDEARHQYWYGLTSTPGMP
jgi:integrase